MPGDRENAKERAVFPIELKNMSLADKAAIVEAWFEAHADTRYNSTNRIGSMCRIVQECAGTEIAPEDARHPALVQALKDVQEYWFAVSVLGEQLNEPPFLSKLIRSGSDTLLASDSTADTAGRDAQFEVFVGAVLARAGCRLEEFTPESADWKAITPASTYSVETKRIKDVDRFEQRVRKAGNQVRKSGIGGVVVIDVSVAVGSGTSTLEKCISEEKLFKAMQRRGEAFFAEYNGQIREWVAGKPVGVVVIHDHVIRPAGVKGNGVFVPWGLYPSWDAFQLVPDDRDQRKRYEEFWSLFATALPQF